MVFAIALVILVVSISLLAVIGFSYFQGQQKYGELARYADLSAVEERGSESASIDWEALRAVNPDVVAWLSIPGTAVNYPVVRGADNEYYLTHDFNGDQGWLATYGAIFMDWRNAPDWSDEAYFIYGHHMNDGSMFADIAGMADQARFDASRTIYLYSPEGDFTLRTFSLVHCAVDDPLVQVAFRDKAEMEAYVKDKMSRSVVFASDVPPASDIVKSFAFATCDNFSSGRYVLYAYAEDATGDARKAMEKAEEGATTPVNDRAAEQSRVYDRN